MRRGDEQWQLSRKSGLAGRCAAGDLRRDGGAAGDGDHAPTRIWAGLAGLVERFMPRNRELLAFRDKLQGQIDEWHREHGPVASDPAGYRGVPARDRLSGAGAGGFRDRDERARSRDFDASAGRSWWCRCRNARYALNAANARWGSLYDALYGTDAISREGELAPGKGLQCRARAAAVVARGARVPR